MWATFGDRDKQKNNNQGVDKQIYSVWNGCDQEYRVWLVQTCKKYLKNGRQTHHPVKNTPWDIRPQNNSTCKNII